MKRLLPLLLTLLGLAAGGAAGLVLQPGTGDAGGAHGVGGKETAPSADAHAGEGASGDGHAAPSGDTVDAVEVLAAPADGHGAAAASGGAFDYVKLTNQFVVPLIEDGRVASMIVLSLSVEVTAGTGDAVFAREPKLRDALLQVLFDHANAGGFRGTFTEAESLAPLRRALREAALKVLPDQVNDVLIADIVRHDS